MDQHTLAQCALSQPWPSLCVSCMLADKTTEFEVPAAMTDTLDKVSAAWEKTEDKPAVATLGVFALIGLVALAGVLKAVDSLPLVPTLLELVGIAYTAVSPWLLSTCFAPQLLSELLPVPEAQEQPWAAHTWFDARPNSASTTKQSWCSAWSSGQWHPTLPSSTRHLSAGRHLA
jgi:hypothetical protein